MNGLLLLVAFVGAVNPARIRTVLPEDDRGRARMPEVIGGAAIGFVVVSFITWASGAILDGLAISDETFRIAAGLVVGIAGVWATIRSAPGPEPELPGYKAAVWPIAFPRIVSPAVVALAMATGPQEGVGRSMVSLAVALGLVVVAGLARRSAVSDGVMRWIGALFGAALVVVAAVLMIDGVRDV